MPKPRNRNSSVSLSSEDNTVLQAAVKKDAEKIKDIADNVEKKVDNLGETASVDFNEKAEAPSPESSRSSSSDSDSENFEEENVDNLRESMSSTAKETVQNVKSLGNALIDKGANAAEKVKDNAQVLGKEVGNEARRLNSKVVETVSPIVNDLQDKTEKKKDAVKNKISSGAQAIGEKKDDLVTQVKNTLSTMFSAPNANNSDVLANKVIVKRNAEIAQLNIPDKERAQSHMARAVQEFSKTYKEPSLTKQRLLISTTALVAGALLTPLTIGLSLVLAACATAVAFHHIRATSNANFEAALRGVAEFTSKDVLPKEPLVKENILQKCLNFAENVAHALTAVLPTPGVTMPSSSEAATHKTKVNNLIESTRRSSNPSFEKQPTQQSTSTSFVNQLGRPTSITSKGL